VEEAVSLGTDLIEAYRASTQRNEHQAPDADSDQSPRASQ